MSERPHPDGGVVYLVGAGPGDPALLTLRARQLLDEADVVAYDELCSDALLACVPARATLVAVGRRGHAGAPVEHAIHPAVLAHARAGRRVLRLKAGDPLVFGRGGEEAAALRDAGVPFEIVPGISSALGAAAYAGIPLTQREVASAVTWATAHDGLGASGDGTIVLFMAHQRLAESLERLVAGGRAPTTPAAWIAAATTARQRVVTGTLADLAARVAAEPHDGAPALVLVGEVVRLRARVAWREARALAGRRVLVGRARPGRSQIAARLAALGAEVLEAPLIGVTQPISYAALDRALAEPGAWGAIVFASAEAVPHTLARLGALDRDVRAFHGVPLVAVGHAAAAALRERGLCASLELSGACAEALGGHSLLRRRLLVLADDGGRLQLAADLRACGAIAEVVGAYRHTVSFPPLRDARFDLVVAPSSTAATRLGDGPYAAQLRPLRWLAIGPRSEAAARKTGAGDVTRADRDDVDAIVTRATEMLS